ncbi:MAG: 5'/3'-nucleotidase SurE [Acidimicrobiia bacterium]|nr:5'/3'-nucleotidase SurE [Acidimicrobiia bacterium]
MAVLVTNDDGIDSPALVPFADALAAKHDVRVVVPDRERSWIGKAITRHGDVVVEERSVGGHTVWACSGYPADCVQLGAHLMFDGLPSLVVSGVNIGYNHGLAYLVSSGTVGAAAEGAISGVPAIAFSVGADRAWDEWYPWARSKDSIPMWVDAAAIAADIVAVITEEGFPEGIDVINVNIPSGADLGTERRITSLARVGYDRLFSRSGPGVFRHDFGGMIHVRSDPNGSDIEAADAGVVSITPIVLAGSGGIPAQLGDALSRRSGSSGSGEF